MLLKEEATAVIQFLDRVAVTGHQERQTMNILVSKLLLIAQPPAEVDDPEEKEEKLPLKEVSKN